MSEEIKKVYLEFVNNKKEKIEVSISVAQTPIGELWYEKIKEFIVMEGWAETRWSGFNLQRRALPILIEKLERCIKKINESWLNTKYEYSIEIDKIPLDYPDEIHNIICSHYATLMGKSEIPSTWYELILDEEDIGLITAIRGLNDLSYEIIDKKNKNPYPHLFFLFNKGKEAVKAVELPAEAENYFELGNKANTVYLAYTQVGNTWLDVIYNKASIDTVEPLKTITGAFTLCFRGDGTRHQGHLLRIKPELKKLGLDPQDKSLRLGRIPVATIDETNPDWLIAKLEEYDQVSGLRVENVKLNLEPYLDPY
jgi:hypothetical protein